MTYDGFVQLAIESLDIHTRKMIQKSDEYDREPYHLDPFPLIKSEVPSPITLQRHGHIQPRTVIAFLGGKLTEQFKANRTNKLLNKSDLVF